LPWGCTGRKKKDSARIQKQPKVFTKAQSRQPKSKNKKASRQIEKKLEKASADAMVASAKAHSDQHHEQRLYEKDLDRTKDVVLGQGNKDNGMEMWIELLMEAVRDTVDDSNIKTLALDINEKVKTNGGRFIDNRQPKEKGVKKFYFEMAENDALNLTMGALCREYVDYNEKTDVLCGRGGAGNNGDGTKQFRKDIRNRLKRYDIPVGQGERHLKTDVAREVVELVYGRGGRYITDENSVKDKFYRVSEDLVVEKKELLKRTSQCFRDELRLKKKRTAAQKATSSGNKKRKKMK
jgi:hypothetical protein